MTDLARLTSNLFPGIRDAFARTASIDCRSGVAVCYCLTASGCAEKLCGVSVVAGFPDSLINFIQSNQLGFVTHVLAYRMVHKENKCVSLELKLPVCKRVFVLCSSLNERSFQWACKSHSQDILENTITKICTQDNSVSISVETDCDTRRVVDIILFIEM
jgi:hypothetical protein